MQNRRLLTVLPLLMLELTGCNRDPKVRAQRYLENGNKFFAKEKFKEASIMYRRALAPPNQRFGEAYYRLGLTDLKLSAYGDAAKMLGYAVELQPENSDAATKLADLYVYAATQDTQNSKALTKDAADLSEKLIAQNPNSFDGHRLAGQVALLNRDPKKAITEFAFANAQRPYQTDLVLAYTNALMVDNEGPEAEKLARGLIEREKTFSPIYDLLYLLYARENRLDDAEQLLRLKVENNPKNPNFLLQLASHEFLAKKRTEMDAIMQKLVDEKQFPEGHLLAGDFYFFRLREFDHAQ